ncbi:hypothetical protein Tco_1041546 [Tanacetum coccineum]|uniref:Retrovirus-related Pol polyprotein from transposon TNT 1-94 n=1 Tax=Tanacetum coccineum TaxID=301880 RepID=A0ABQ5GGG2_9ASTR
MPRRRRKNSDTVVSPNLLGFLLWRLHIDTITKFLKPSLVRSDGVVKNYDAIYMHSKSTWDDLILYHEGPSNVKESRVMDLKLCYNTFKFKEGENLTQTFTRYKALLNELVNNGIKLSKLEINNGFINGLPKKWLSFCQSLRKTNHVKDFELASLFEKHKYEENLINNSPDDEEDTRSCQEYMIDLEMEFHERSLLAKSKSAKNGEWVKISMRKVHTLLEMEDNDKRKSFLDYLGTDFNFVEEQRNNLMMKHRAEGFDLPNHDTGRILPSESQVKVTDSSVDVTDSSVTNYDSAEESSLVCSTPLPPLDKLAGVKPVSGPKTIKSILKSNSTFNAETLNGVTINEPTSVFAKGNKKVITSKKNSAPTG